MKNNSIISKDSDIQWNDEAGHPIKITGDFSLPVRDTSDDSIKAFLYENGDELGFNDIGYEDLKKTQDISSPVRRVVRFQQYKDGIPVYGAVVSVQLDEDNRVRQLDLNQTTKTEVVNLISDNKLTPEKAQKAAYDSLGNFTLRQQPPLPQEVYYPTSNGLKPAYRILIPTTAPAHDWNMIIDSYTGEILLKEDLIVYYPDGAGLIFDPNPVVTAQSNTLRDPNATQTDCGFTGSQRVAIDNQRVQAVLKDLTFSAGKYQLEGPHVKMVNTWGKIEVPKETNPDGFLDKTKYSSGKDAFGDVNVYYHIDSFQRYIQKIGITTAHSQQIEADAHDSDGGGWFSPADKALHFGRSAGWSETQKKYLPEKCKPDRCQDGECFIHEYNHAIMHHYVPGYGPSNPITKRNEARALGEGFGDVLACIYFAEKGGGYQREVFEDWCFADEGGLRRVDGNKMYPWNIPTGPGGNWIDEEHADGEILSAALWRIYLDMGGNSLKPSDRIAAGDSLIKTIISSYPSLTQYASMPDGAQAMMQIHADLEFRGEHLREMLNRFHERGILHIGSGANLQIVAGADFWDSPNLWIRNENDNIQIHQNPEYGQDNWFYARVSNHGTEAARAFVVTFNVKPWLGTEFIYPGDFIPFISAVAGFNLAPGASTIVRAKWPKAFVPAAGTHGCLLASVYLPTDPIPFGVHVWDHENLGQKNLEIVDLKPNDSKIVSIQLGNELQLKSEAYRIELHRPEKWSHIPVEITHRDPEVAKKLYQSIKEFKIPAEAAVVSAGPFARVVEMAKIELGYSGTKASPVLMTLSPGSTIEFASAGMARPMAIGDGFMDQDAELHTDSNERSSIAFKLGKEVGFPVLFEAMKSTNINLKVTAPPEARPGESFDVDLVQRNSSGQIVGGIRIHANIVE